MYKLEAYRKSNGLGSLGGPVTAQVGTAVASTGSAIGTALAIGGSAGGPIGAAVGLVVGLIGGLLFKPDVKKLAATSITDQITPYMQANLDSWKALPDNQKTPELQAQYLANFDAYWTQLVNSCSNPQLESAGQNCISDRQQGACKWRDDTGQCWNYFTGFRDPIANDPAVAANSTPTAILSSFGLSGSSMLLVGGAAVVLAGLFMSGD